MRLLLVLALMLLGAPAALAAEATVAVAANFLEPARALVERFRSETGRELRMSSGSTGKLYLQIREGAPFDLFLAADRKHPELLAAEGLASSEPFTYAIGRLALWSADSDLLEADVPMLLKAATFRRLAVAHPELAPYGQAAREALEALGAWEAVQPKLVRGESVAQTFQFVATGNAELGFVALSQIVRPGEPARGSRWVVPAELHAPLKQDAVLLRRGAGNEAAREFLAFLGSPIGRSVIDAYGYGVGD